MFHRLLKPSSSSSFFIFGARGTGKSTFVKNQIKGAVHTIDLLEDKWESRYLKDPDLLIHDVAALKKSPKWIFIDEVQKVPKLLDVVHQLIEKQKNIRFILTGSSARKLKRGAANLLAGRAFLYHLFPLTQKELGVDFSLEHALNWGTLPKTFELGEEDREEYLRSYCQVYLKEEILQEQIVRNGLAFRNFLEVAAQENGKLLNFSKIARDLGVDTKTAQSFFQILEDTLLGFFLSAFHRSARKSVKMQPKFYLFDLGVKRSLEHSLKQGLTPKTSSYGAAFEHFIICECFRLNSYLKCDYQLHHYQTSAGGEVDLVLSRGRETIVAEIKSSERIDLVEVRALSRVASALNPSKIFYVSRDTVRSQVGDVRCLHWKDFLAEVFLR